MKARRRDFGHGKTLGQFLDTLPRDERMYASHFAHWLDETGDNDRAAREAEPHQVGIRAGRAARIRRDVEDRWTPEPAGQSRLPGDVGAVRAMEVQTAPIMELPRADPQAFSLTAEVLDHSQTKLF